MAHPILPQIAVLLGQFLTLEFGTNQAIRGLGTVVQGDDPKRLVLKPTGARADYVILHIEDLNFEKEFLTSIEFAWTTPPKMKLAELTELFGPPRIVKRLMPDLVDLYLFDIRHMPLMGQVSVAVSAHDKNDNLTVTTISARRFVPEPYSLDQGRAVRFIVLADLGATELRPDPWPQPAYIWEKAGINELMERLRPAFRFQVENRLGDSGPALDITFRPTMIDHLRPNAMSRRIAPLAALLDLRDVVGELVEGKTTPEKVGARVDLHAIPTNMRPAANAVLRGDKQQSKELIERIDVALSDQLQAILVHRGFQEFQAAWLGVDYLANHVDFKDGSRLEVHSSPLETTSRVLSEGVLEDELNHPNGAPPAVTIVDGAFRAGSGDFTRLGRLAEDAARAEMPVVFGIDPAAENFVPSAWSRLAGDNRSRFLVGCYPRFCVRKALDETPDAISFFRYRPSRPARAETAVWASAAWLLAAIMARSQATSGHLINWDVGADLPPLVKGGGSTAAIFEPIHEGAHTRPSEVPLNRLSYEPALGFRVEGRLRTVGQSTSNDSPSRLLLTAPLRGTIRRIEHQTRHGTSADDIRRRLHEMLQARIPGAAADVAFEGDPAKDTARLRIQVTLPFAVDGDRTVRLEQPWKKR